MSPEVFHWESQNATSPECVTGRRYLNHKCLVSHVLLFTRPRQRDENGMTMPYTCLEQLDYRSHSANRVGLGLVPGTRAFLDSLTGPELECFLIGGLTTLDLPVDYLGGYVGLVRWPEYLLPPLPNTFYTRDTTCWINGGLTLNPPTLACPA